MTLDLSGVWLGRRNYNDTYHLQNTLLERRRAGTIGNTVLLLEHDATITSGRGAHPENVRASATTLAERHVHLQQTNRGGDVTVHAPGQLVAYPIVELPSDQRDVRKYVRGLSEVMRRLVARHGIDAGSIDSYVGLWADASSVADWPGAERAERPVKLGAIGVRISRWITMHGFALNYTTDMTLFNLVVPCGISSLGVASVEQLTGKRPSVSDEAPYAHQFIAEQLGIAPAGFRSLADRPLEELLSMLPNGH